MEVFILLAMILGMQTSREVKSFSDCKKEDFKPLVCKKYEPKK